MNEFQIRMPKKAGKRNLSAKTTQSIRCKAARLSEENEENKRRLKSQKEYQAEKRKNETPEETEVRLANARDRDAYKRNKKQKTQSNAAENQNRDEAEMCIDREAVLKKKTEAAMMTGEKLGAIKNIDLFNENEYPRELCHHELKSLYDADNICPHCSAYRWKEERPGFCCENGKVKLSPIKMIPEEVKDLYKDKDFLQNIRSYNNALALASIGCDEQYVPGFSPTFKIQGKVFHRIGSLKPNDGECPKFAQIYFHDSENELENRLNHNPHLSKGILSRLQDCLKKVNPYIQSLQYASDISEKNPDVKVVIHADKKPKDEHARKYNLPVASEIAVIMPGDQEGHLDVVIKNKGGGLQTINALHRSYDPLHYVLLFPGGDDGYTDTLKKETKGRTNGKAEKVKGNEKAENEKEQKVKHISPVEFYKYRLQVRKMRTQY